MEKKALTVPKDVFKSKFRWRFFQLRKDPMESLPLIFWVLSFAMSPQLFTVASIIRSRFSTGARRALKKNIEVLCDEVIDQRPGVDSLKWNLITQRLNDTLYDEGLYRNRYCIFDGEHCQELFRELVLRPSLQTADESLSEAAGGAKASRLYQEDLIRQCKSFIDDGKLEVVEDFESYEKLPCHAHFNKISWLVCSFLSYTLQPPNCFCPILVLSANFSANFRVTVNLLMLIALYLIGVVLYPRMKIKEMKIEERLKFLKTISLVKPHAQIEGWNIVAKRMNKYMYEEKGWHNREFFYNGEDCLNAFKMEFASVLSSTKPINYGSRSKYLDLKPFIEAAVRYNEDEDM